jgi:hypothetical protein
VEVINIQLRSIFYIRHAPRLIRLPGSRTGGRQLRGCARLDRTPLFDFRTQKLPTNLADLSVTGARLALLKFASVDIAQELVDASVVGRGIGDADTGIVGVCLCWRNAEGCHCYGCRRRHAHYCPLHQFFLF